MTRQGFSVDGLRRRTEVVVDSEWNTRIVVAVERRVRRRRLIGRATVGAAAVLLLGSAAWWRLSPTPQQSASLAQAPASPAQDDRIVHFDDWATGRLATVESHAVVTERSPSHTTVAVSAGAVGFDVTHTGREFRVDAGPIRVVVVGTAFIVDRRSDGVDVSVQRGRVRVEADGATVAVGAGEKRWFPITTATATAMPTAADEIQPAPTPSPIEASRPSPGPRVLKHPTPRWRVLAQRGDFRRAYRLLGRPGGTPRDEVEELLLAADVARKSSHFAAAIPYYDRVIVSHADDPRAALAALSKGRVALHQLGRPREAAAAFAQARALSLPEGLSEDALIGEVTAWRRAGEAGKARTVAEEFIRRYPRSPSVENVRRLGDLR
jgi:transmembrane sensor